MFKNKILITHYIGLQKNTKIMSKVKIYDFKGEQSFCDYVKKTKDMILHIFSLVFFFEIKVK